MESQYSLIAAAMSNLPTGAFICDRKGVVRFINIAYAQYLGLRPEEAIGRHITNLIPDSGIPAVLRSGKAAFGQVRHFPDAGATLLVNRIPLFDASGELIGALSWTLFDDAAQVADLLKRIQQLDRKMHFWRRRARSALSALYTVDSIIGESPAIASFKETLLRYAKTGEAVLISGKTGTGKELAAGAIHAASPRAAGPFVAINCAAIPRELFESEVFGYAAGAFSGARKEGNIGKLEMAHEGTLFLDEIGDLPLQAQAKLLRVLEEGQFFPLGSSRPRSANFRLIAATNRDLREMIAAKTFREDLFYRINSLKLTTPLLCERREDIPLLAAHFAGQMADGETLFTDEAMAVLTRYPWPGNVRELRNAVGHALSLSRDGRITPNDLPPECLRPGYAAHAGATLRDIAGNVEGAAIEDALRKTGGNKVKAAAMLGISRATLYARLNRLRAAGAWGA